MIEQELRKLAAAKEVARKYNRKNTILELNKLILEITATLESTYGGE